MSKRAARRVRVPAVAPQSAAETRVELARSELLGFPALHLPRLPLHVRIGVEAPGFAHAITLCSGVASAPQAEPGGAILFEGDELQAIAIAVQAERMWPA